MQIENRKKRMLTRVRGVVGKVNQGTGKLENSIVNDDKSGTKIRILKNNSSLHKLNKIEDMIEQNEKIVKLSYNISNHSKILGKRLVAWTRANVTNKFKHCITMLWLKLVKWLTYNIQSECFISAMLL